MFQRRIPESLRHAQASGAKGFAALAAVECAARGILISVFPIVMHRAFVDVQTVSEIYLLVGVLSFLAALVTPWVSSHLPRRWLYTLATIAMTGVVLSAAILPAGALFPASQPAL